MGNSLCRMWLAVPVHLSKFLSSEDPSNMLRILVFGKSRVFCFFFLISLWLAVPRKSSGKDKQDRSMTLAATLHLTLGSREWVGSGPVTAMEAQSFP